MTRKHSIRNLLLTGAVTLAWPALAAEVTPDRLNNADKEPQNWLMNHRTYDGQRFSPLDKINKANVKSMKLEYAVAIGGTSANENLEVDAARRGRLPLRRRPMGRALQDRRPFRRRRPHPLAHGSGPGEAAAVEPGRRAVGQSGRHHGELSGTRHRHQQGNRQGRVGDEPQRSAGRAAHRSAARGEGQDHHRRGGWRPRRARLDRGARRRDRQARMAQVRHPGAGRARQRDLEGQEQRLADRRRRDVDHRLLRCRQRSGDLGHRQSGADVRRHLSARRQSLHRQRDLVESRFRQDELVLPVHARRPLGLRRGRHRTS